MADAVEMLQHGHLGRIYHGANQVLPPRDDNIHQAFQPAQRRHFGMIAAGKQLYGVFRQRVLVQDTSLKLRPNWYGALRARRAR